MRWLILGGGGQLAHALERELHKTEVEFVSLDRSQLDITDENAINSRMGDIAPDVVLNAAAWTKVDEAEAEEANARAVNSYGAELLARASAERGAKFVHISTDYVFSGISNTPWAESSPTAPVSAYGRTKAEGEMLAQKAHPLGTFIVRTAWLYSPWGKNFAKTMVRLAAQDAEVVEVVCDQIGQPTSAIDLAEQIHEMIDRDVPAGIYHGTNSGESTWFEFAQQIFTLCGADPKRVVPVDTSHFPRPAKRPMYSVLSHQHWIEVGMNPMRDWRDALIAGFPEIIVGEGSGEIVR